MNRNVLVVVALLLSVLLTGCSKILFGEKTDFSSGYSEHKFQEIRQGMGIPKVVGLIGAPLTITTQQWSEVWSYWPPGSEPNPPRKKDGSLTYNLFGKVTHLHFSVAGVVTGESGDYLNRDVVGLTKQQVQSEVGEPNQRELKQFAIIYHYSAPGKSGTGTFKRREVLFDATNVVSSVVAEMYYD